MSFFHLFFAICRNLQPIPKKEMDAAEDIYTEIMDALMEEGEK